MYNPPLEAPFIPKYQPKIRREAVNSSPYVFTQFSQQQDDTSAHNRPFMDMAPLNSRTDSRDYRQAQPYVPQINTAAANNPYFAKYDVTQDPRNVIREMKGAVYEERTTRGSTESKALMDRGLLNRWISPEQAEEDKKAWDRGAMNLSKPMPSGMVEREFTNSNSGRQTNGW
jgi:hypothetical protein